MKSVPPHTADSHLSPQESTKEVLRLAREQPQLGQAAVAKQLQQAGIKISASGVRYIWKKYSLETTAKRLQALNSDGTGQSLSKDQQHLLDRKLLTQTLQKEGTAAGEGENGRRTIILNSAAKLFAENGFDRTSMRDIARHAGLLPGSVYHYFASKAALFLVTHQEGFNATMKQVRAAAQEGTDPWDSLTRALTVHIDCMVSDTTPTQRLTGQSLAMQDHPGLREQLKPYRTAYEDFIRQLIDKLPLHKDSDRTLLRLTLLGAGNWVFIWYREGKKTPREIVSGMVNMLRNGVATQ